MADQKRIKRATLLDTLPLFTDRNLFCEQAQLTNEASVETFFVLRLLKDLGYQDNQIKPKTSISQVTVSKGSRRIRYKPDYILMYRGTPRWILDAKSPSADIEDWEEQASGYCLHLNQRAKTGNPVEYYVLTNGITTRLYHWDKLPHILELRFEDFQIGNPKYEQLKTYLAPRAFEAGRQTESSELFEIRRPTPQQARRLFSQAHRIIWQSEVINPSAAFTEFAKLMFVKLWADRMLREDPVIATELESKGKAQVPKNGLTFSTFWIDSQKPSLNPVNDILFRQLLTQLERDIIARKKKRIYDSNETINLRPSTVYRVVEKLQRYDMFGIDEDLNGRLFETFLSATMRGRELGQFFTPRSIVKLMTKLARLRADKDHVDKVLDACCGTGGFLIEALTEMRNKVRNNDSLSNTEKTELLSTIANESIYGIEFGKNPPLARIARMNMYLHGDGGSRIYFADALDKSLRPTEGDNPEVQQEQDELRERIESGLRFDVVLTNPPFSMTKSLDKEEDAVILRQYELSKYDGKGSLRRSLRSSVMFVERYHDLLKPGGMLITVLDDTVLASRKFGFFRDFVRRKFVIKGIISLPGDAFRRQGSRVKTSVLLLQKKTHSEEEQSAAFGAFTLKLGVDDLTPRASEAQIQEARAEAEEEIERVLSEFEAFLAGKPQGMTIPANRLMDRLDLKHCSGERGRLVPEWQRKGIQVVTLQELVDGGIFQLVEDTVDPKDEPDQEFKLLSVTYGGECELESIRTGSQIRADSMYSVRTHDLVISMIRVTDGAAAIVPEEFDGALVSSTSYLLLRGRSITDTIYLWSVLRSHEIRADLQSISPGTNRYVTYWDDAKNIKIPWLEEEKRKQIANLVQRMWEHKRAQREMEARLLDEISELGVESEESKRRFEASKAPK